ncbi:MAG: Rrf2 family transcriptional regulator [Acidobacteriota bacterium]|nr:Rrf2 family transcriptional regulator [Acidobacteriota bacterium]
MKISTKGEYGIRAMLYVAMHANGGPVPSHEIAVNQGIPEPYLRQILAALARDHLIRSNRGPQGGHLLGRPAEKISMHDILVALEGHTTSIDHILAQPCTIGVGPKHCAIREVFLSVKEAVETILCNYSLADLAARQQEVCECKIEIPHDLPPERLSTSTGRPLHVIAD